MPRKSAAALAVAPPVVTQVFPPPPARLGTRAAEIWTEITRSKPGNFFDATGRLLLELMVSHLAAAEEITQQIDAERVAKTATDGRMDWLLKLRAKESAQAASLSTKLRLSAQSRLSAAQSRTAAREGERANAPKPWEPPRKPAA